MNDDDPCVPSDDGSKNADSEEAPAPPTDDTSHDDLLYDLDTTGVTGEDYDGGPMPAPGEDPGRQPW